MTEYTERCFGIEEGAVLCEDRQGAGQVTIGKG